MCYMFQPENFAAFKSCQMGAANPGSSSASSALPLGLFFHFQHPWALVSCHCHPALEVRGQMVLCSSNCQFSSVHLLSHVWLFVTSWSAAHQSSLSITNSRSLLKLMSIGVSDTVQPSHPCHPVLFLLSIFPSIRVFSNESVLRIRWPKDWSFSTSISPCNEYSGLISFRIDWFDLLAVQGTLKSLLQYRSSKALVLWCSAFFVVQLSHPYMTTGKTVALTIWTFVNKVMSLLFNK